MIQDTVRELEENIRQAKAIIEVENCLDRLEKNPDFRKVIGEGYFKDEAVRLVHLKSEPAVQSAEKQASILTQIDSIGNLSGYLRTIRHKAAQARKAVDQDEETLQEVLAEEVQK